MPIISSPIRPVRVIPLGPAGVPGLVRSTFAGWGPKV